MHHSLAVQRPVMYPDVEEGHCPASQATESVAPSTYEYPSCVQELTDAVLERGVPRDGVLVAPAPTGSRSAWNSIVSAEPATEKGGLVVPTEPESRARIAYTPGAIEQTSAPLHPAIFEIQSKALLPAMQSLFSCGRRHL